MPGKYAQFNCIIKKHGLTKQEVVLDFTEGRTDSLRQLSDGEFAELMRRITKYNTPPPGDKQRKKMISIARNMRWGISSKDIVSRLDEWLLKQKFKKKLNDLSVAELGLMLTVLEQKVYPDFLEHNV